MKRLLLTIIPFVLVAACQTVAESQNLSEDSPAVETEAPATDEQAVAEAELVEADAKAAAEDIADAEEELAEAEAALDEAAADMDDAASELAIAEAESEETEELAIEAEELTAEIEAVETEVSDIADNSEDLAAELEVAAEESDATEEMVEATLEDEALEETPAAELIEDEAIETDAVEADFSAIEPVQAAEGSEIPAQAVEVTPISDETEIAIPRIRTFLAWETSDLMLALVSPSIMNDDVALMGVVSGAREYCGLEWQPGFITFIEIAKRQNLLLDRVATDHGYYQGVARRSLQAAEYACVEEDFASLAAIVPY